MDDDSLYATILGLNAALEVERVEPSEARVVHVSLRGAGGDAVRVRQTLLGPARPYETLGQVTKQ